MTASAGPAHSTNYSDCPATFGGFFTYAHLAGLPGPY